MAGPRDLLLNKVIVVADDEPDLREIVATELEFAGARVHSFENGRAAFDFIQTAQVDAVVSDVRMPGGDGSELLKRLRDLDPVRPAVCFMTGYADLGLDEAYASGVEALFAKPFELRSVLDSVWRVTLPTEERLSIMPASPSVKIVRGELPSWESFLTGGAWHLGRGGFFWNAPRGNLFLGDHVRIELRFLSGPISTVTGEGVVRWIRPEIQDGRPEGIGLEFSYLNEDCRGPVIEVLKSLRDRAFIPLQ